MESLKRVRPFLEELKSAAPTPGGGAVAALVGALAASLGHMVGSLTVGKKKFAAVEDSMRSAMARLAADVDRCLELADEDARAFDAYMAASKLPREDAAQQAVRKEALAAAALGACRPPLATIECLQGMLPAIRMTAEKGNPHALSDAGVAALLVTAAARSAALNVRINLPSLAPGARQELAKDLDGRLEALLGEAAAIAEMVESALTPSTGSST